MRIINGYLLRTVVSNTTLVVFVVLALTGFVNFVGQTDDVGKGSYDLANAAVYTLLRLPTQALEVLPVAALIGSLLGLGGLAVHSELVVIRAAGVSLGRFALSVATAGVLLLVVAAALSEFIAPPMEAYARQYRLLLKHEELSVASTESSWLKEGDRIVNVIQDPNGGGGVTIFKLDENQRLVSLAKAGSARFDANGRWRLQNYEATQFSPTGVTSVEERAFIIEEGFNPDLLGLSVVDPDDLTAAGMDAYIRFLEANDLDAYTYKVALQVRLSTIVSVVVLTIMAVPFVFGPLRSAGAGGRLMVGVLIGVAYLLASKTLLNSGEVYGLHPALIAWGPTAALAVVTLIAFLRTR